MKKFIISHNIPLLQLTDESGPAHKKSFTVCLLVGDEEYNASGPSIKKAQHAAAAIALEKTKLKHPPPKQRIVKNRESLATKAMELLIIDSSLFHQPM